MNGWLRVFLVVAVGMMVSTVGGCGLILDDPAIEVVNNSGGPLEQVEIVMQYNKTRERYVVGHLAKGERRRVPRKTSDLYLRELSYKMGETVVRPEAWGQATPNEVLFVIIGKDGGVETQLQFEP